MPQTYMRTWPGSIGVKGSVARVSVLWMRSVMQRGACFAPLAASRIAARRAFGIVCVPYNRFSIAARPEHRNRRAAVPLEQLPSTMQFRILARRVAALAVALRGLRDAGPRRHRRRAERGHPPASRGPDAPRRSACRSRPAAQPKDAQMRFLKRVMLVDIEARRPRRRRILQPLVAGLPRARRAAQQPGRAVRRRGRLRARRAPRSSKRCASTRATRPPTRTSATCTPLLAAQSYAQRADGSSRRSATVPRKLALVRQLTAISSEPTAAPPRRPRGRRRQRAAERVIPSSHQRSEILDAIVSLALRSRPRSPPSRCAPAARPWRRRSGSRPRAGDIVIELDAAKAPKTRRQLPRST